MLVLTVEQIPTTVEMHCMWRETNNRLDVLARRVGEGKDVLAASEFARYLLFSGFLKMFERNPQDFPLKVDGHLLRWKCGDLLDKCARAWKDKNGVVHLDLSQLENVNRKLDIIAAHVSKFSPPLMDKTADVGNTAEPALRVLQGGA